MQILDLQPQISKVFLNHQNNFSRSRLEQFWQQNTISRTDFFLQKPTTSWPIPSKLHHWGNAIIYLLVRLIGEIYFPLVWRALLNIKSERIWDYEIKHSEICTFWFFLKINLIFFFLFLATKFQVVFDAIKIYRLSANTNICFFAWLKKNFANICLH